MTTTAATQLNTLISCRIRLTDDQRTVLKDAYNKLSNTYAPAQGARIGGSSIQTETSYGIKVPNLLPKAVFSDIVASRDSIALTAIRQLEEQLNVSVVTKTQVEEACKGYVEHIFGK